MDERLSSKAAIEQIFEETGKLTKKAGIDDVAAQIILETGFLLSPSHSGKPNTPSQIRQLISPGYRSRLLPAPAQTDDCPDTPGQSTKQAD